MTPRTRIVLADDHELVLEGLKSLLDAEEDMEVVAAVTNGDALLDAIRRRRPDVAVLDLEMGEPDGLACLDAIAGEGLPVRVVVLTAHSDPRIMRSVWEKGAAGFALKSESPRQTVAVIRQVARGQMVFPLAARSAPARASATDALTDRETVVLAALAEGLSNGRIARKLGISENTVKFHLQNLYLKLGVRTRTEAVASYLSSQGVRAPQPPSTRDRSGRSRAPSNG